MKEFDHHSKETLIIVGCRRMDYIINNIIKYKVLSAFFRKKNRMMIKENQIFQSPSISFKKKV